MDRIDVFLLRRDLQLAEGCCDAGNRNLLFPAALVVSPNCITQGSFKEADYDSKSRYSGWRNVLRSITWRRIRVVDHKRLSAPQAGCEQELLPLPRSQHIQADANVRLEEAFAIERSLPGILNANENYRLHWGTTDQASRLAQSKRPIF
jgi:hypothetical protein